MTEDHASQNQNTPTKVLIASDRILFRTALAELLGSRGFEVVGEAGEEPQVVNLARKLKPDAIVVDLERGGTRLPKAIDKVRESSPHTEVVVVTRFDSPMQARAFLSDGAHAYLGKSATIEDLLMTLHHSGKDPVRKPGTATMVISKQAAQLTDRELEIMLLAARGLSNQQIANELFVSESTVKRHLANIYSKNRVSSRSEATVKALAEGWISAQDILRPSE